MVSSTALSKSLALKIVGRFAKEIKSAVTLVLLSRKGLYLSLCHEAVAFEQFQTHLLHLVSSFDARQGAIRCKRRVSAEMLQRAVKFVYWTHQKANLWGQTCISFLLLMCIKVLENVLAALLEKRAHPEESGLA